MGIKLLIDGEEAFRHIFEEIDRAKNRIFIKMFIWRNDRIGRQLGERVLAAADRGVSVHIEKDQIGGMFEYAEEGKDSFFHDRLPPMVRLQSFILDKFYPMPGKAPRHPQALSPLARTLLGHPRVTVEAGKRLYDHSKCYLIDDRVLILGGMNVEDKEITADVEGNLYHDFMVKVESEKGVGQFLEALRSGGNRSFDIGSEKQSNPEQLDFLLNVRSPGSRNMIFKEGLLNRLRQAEKSLHIIMAYLGDRDVFKCLNRLSERGVAIQIFVPQKANIQNDLNLLHLRSMLKKANRGIELYLCRDLIHAKAIWIDQEYLLLGSANLNKQAMRDLGEADIGFFTEPWQLSRPLHAVIDGIRKQSVRIEHYRELNYRKWKAFLEGLL